MKILQVTPRYPPQSGGVETHVQEISEQLVGRGHDVTVLTADAGGEGQRFEQRNGVRIQRYRSVAPGDTAHFCPQVMGAVRSASVDVVHAHNYHSFPLFFAALGISDQRFVVTTHYHGGSASSVRDRLLSLYSPLGRWAVRQADKVIAVSEWEKEQLISDFDVEPIVIPNGLDIGRFTEVNSVTRDRPYLLMVGRLKKYKGIQHVIRAMPTLPNHDLLVAGSGSYRKKLEQIARENEIEDRVKFLGYVDDKKLPQLYAGADVYVTMSEFEAYGMTVAEALAVETPCVVRKTGALSDWVTCPGVIGVTSTSPMEISEAVNSIREKKVTKSDRVSSWGIVTDSVERHYYA